MARKQYIGAKLTILTLAGAAVLTGTAWLSSNGQPAATAIAATQPVSPSSSNVTTTISSTVQPSQAPAPRAKRSRGS